MDIVEGEVCVERHDFENNKCTELVTVEDIMSFTTGISQVPFGGFHATPSIKFLHGVDKVLATASTCSLQLRLPTKYGEDYTAFESSLILSIKGNMGFGIH